MIQADITLDDGRFAVLEFDYDYTPAEHWHGLGEQFHIHPELLFTWDEDGNQESPEDATTMHVEGCILAEVIAAIKAEWRER